MSSPYVPSPGQGPQPIRVKKPGVWTAGDVLRVVVKGLIAILVLDAAQMVLGTYLTEVPPIGLAAGVVSVAPMWFVLVPVLLAVLTLLIWWAWPGHFRTTLVVIAVLTALGAGFITARMALAVQDAGVTLTASQFFPTTPLNRGEPDASPVYLTRDNESLNIDVYRPAGSAAKAPVLLYVHGGGWTKGDPGDRSSDMRWFADRGYLVLSVEYTLSSQDEHLWDVTQGQIGCSLSWVAKNASKYGGDPGRLSLAGDSAGGTLAINAAYLQAAGDLPSACGGEPAIVSAVSTIYPAVDLTAVHNDSPDGAQYTRDYIGGSPEKFPERYDAASSSTKVTANAPPTFILTGKVDRLVPIESIESFVDDARAADIETKLVQVPFADHGFDFLSGNFGDQAFRQLTVKWLSQHGQAP